MACWSWISKSGRTSRCSASAFGEPRSLNTVPVERVTLCVSLGIACLPYGDEITEPLAAEIELTEGYLSRGLLAGAKHVHGFLEGRHLADAVFTLDVNAELPNAGPEGRHRLPVVRVEPLLNTAKLEARQASGVWRKRSAGAARASVPQHGLVAHLSRGVYEFLYAAANTRKPRNCSRPAATGGTHSTRRSTSCGASFRSYRSQRCHDGISRWQTVNSSVVRWAIASRMRMACSIAWARRERGGSNRRKYRRLQLLDGDAARENKCGGPDGIRTRDLVNAIHARSQLRHWPSPTLPF